MHNRRARPTLRVLKEDLTSGWVSPMPRRWITSGEHSELHPISELPHPIVMKATESFGSDAADDNFVGPIVTATKLRLLEIKQSQWRGGVWQDHETGVCWLVVAGLAKGGHQDRDDFYKRVQRDNDTTDLAHWLPTAEDVRLLKQETAARIRTDWELEIQRLVRDALRAVQAGGTHRVAIEHPIPGNGTIAYLDLCVVIANEGDYQADEIDLEIVPDSRFAGSNLLWQLTTRILVSISPPEQSWDRYKDTYSNIGEPGVWSERVAQLDELDRTGALAESVPGTTSHYSHRKHLAGSTINGTAIRALCGAFFVPTQDHEGMPECPTCKERFAALAE